MRILIIPAFFRTKSRPTLGSFFWEQALALQKAGHQVTILYCDTYSVKCIGEYLTYAEEAHQQVKGVAIWRKKMFCPFKHGIEGHREAFAKGIEQLYSKYSANGEKTDVIHAHCCVWAGFAAMKLSEQTGIPYVITEHATLFQLHADQIRAANERIIAQAFQRAAKVICVSKAFAGLIAKYRAAEEIEIIGNLVDCDLFRPAQHQKNTHIRFLTICYMQTEDQLYKKGIDVLLKAWKTITDEQPTARLAIGGGGQAVAKAKEWCNAYGISDSVEWLGTLERSQVVSQMQQCDCFVLPSRYETFGVVYIEAMACGKPVIATANGGPDDFVDTSNGILIPPDDMESLIAAFRQYLRERELYHAEIIRASVTRRFHAPAIAAQLERIYQSLQ